MSDDIFNGFGPKRELSRDEVRHYLGFDPGPDYGTGLISSMKVVSVDQKTKTIAVESATPPPPEELCASCVGFYYETWDANRVPANRCESCEQAYQDSLESKE